MDFLQLTSLPRLHPLPSMSTPRLWGHHHFSHLQGQTCPWSANQCILWPQQSDGLRHGSIPNLSQWGGRCLLWLLKRKKKGFLWLSSGYQRSPTRPGRCWGRCDIWNSCPHLTPWGENQELVTWFEPLDQALHTTTWSILDFSITWTKNFLHEQVSLSSSLLFITLKYLVQVLLQLEIN